MSAIRRATVFTHRRPTETGPSLQVLIDLAREAGAVLVFDAEETRKHGLGAAEGLELDGSGDHDVDICFALGGDGTILTALRKYAGTGIPVFGVNFGEIGFLATIDRDECTQGFRRAFEGQFETLSLPGIELAGSPRNSSTFPGRGDPESPDGRGRWLAMNDISMHRQPGMRVADLEYAVGEQEIGRVRCDGLVVATPAGSTGYNLANGGPVMAWGVAGFVVSFIAPHSLTARALVVAPGDVLVVSNRSQDEPVDVTIDGRPVCVLPPGEEIEARFIDGQGTLAQVAGTTFYGRLREKFGRLATPP